VTEQVIEAWATGAIPLYWGCDPESYINPLAVLNLNDFNNLEDFINRVKEVSQDRFLWESIASQPILLRKPDLSKVNQVLSSALKALK
jgi:hypothetical protein